MKKIFLLLLAVVLTVPMLAGCNKSGKNNSETEADVIGSLKTLGDVLAIQSVSDRQWSAYDKKIVYVFNYKDTVYRVISDSSQEIEDKISELDYSDEQVDKKFAEIISGIEIGKIENLSELIPKQEDLDKLVGKTGEDLLNDGWYYNGGNLEKMEFFMCKNPFAYIVTFDGKLENTDDFDEEAIRPLKIKSVVYDGLGDATEIDEPEE